MTLKAVLKKLNIDVTTNTSPLANQLKCDLISQNYIIDYDKEINNVTDDDFYQIGRSIFLPQFTEKPFSYIELVEKMKNDIIKITEEN